MTRRIEHEDEAITGVDNARRYLEIHSKHANLIYSSFLRDIARLDVSGRCLEVGAGPGILACMMAEANPNVHVTALDLSPDMAAVAKDHIVERSLQDRVDYFLGDVNDENTLKELRGFNLVYSTFSMHHWKEPIASIRNLCGPIGDGGVLYIHDFKRVRWASLLPLGKGDKDSIYASYTPIEIKLFLEKAGIVDYEIKALFPFFFQSVIIRK